MRLDGGEERKRVAIEAALHAHVELLEHQQHLEDAPAASVHRDEHGAIAAQAREHTLVQVVIALGTASKLRARERVLGRVLRAGYEGVGDEERGRRGAEHALSHGSVVERASVDVTVAAVVKSHAVVNVLTAASDAPRGTACGAPRGHG